MGVLQVVVVVLKRAFGVVGWVDEDAFHLPPVKGQQGFEGFEVVALDEQVVVQPLSPALSPEGRGSNNRRGMDGHLLQQPVGHAGGGGEGACAVEPVEGGHGVGWVRPG